MFSATVQIAIVGIKSGFLLAVVSLLPVQMPLISRTGGLSLPVLNVLVVKDPQLLNGLPMYVSYTIKECVANKETNTLFNPENKVEII